MKRITFTIGIIACLLGGCSSGGDISKNQYDTMYSHLTAMWAESLKGADYKVAFFGDSRIALGNFQEEFKEYKAVNLGVGGDRIDDLLKRFVLIEAAEPEITFVQIGGNDVLAGSLDIDRFTNSFDSLMSKFINANTKVVLHKVAGINEKHEKSPDEYNQIVEGMKKINEVIENMSIKYKTDVIDTASLFDDDRGMLKNEYTTDGVHFNETANEIWYQEIDNYLSNFYSK